MPGGTEGAKKTPEQAAISEVLKVKKEGTKPPKWAWIMALTGQKTSLKTLNLMRIGKSSG
jgi:hypothetical protein